MQEKSTDSPLSLLLVIVNRGMGSAILKFACQQGASDASALLGKGTVNSRFLKIMEASGVEKEIILILIAASQEEELLNRVNDTFSLDKRHRGIAFTVPLAGIMRFRRQKGIRWAKVSRDPLSTEYEAILAVVGKSQAVQAVALAQSEGHYGGTIIKARGTAGEAVLNQAAEPEQALLLMILRREASRSLAQLLTQELKLKEGGAGSLFRIAVNATIGLYEEGREVMRDG